MGVVLDEAAAREETSESSMECIALTLGCPSVVA
jgi:hypothetical protein